MSEENSNLEKTRRRRISERLKALRERSRLLELELQNYTNSFFRVCIFGSARIKHDDENYKTTFDLAKRLGEKGVDVLTGGGPGLMEAANRGVLEGRKEFGTNSRSFGLTIELNKFEIPSEHLDTKLHHRRFSSRLDDFMRLSHAIIVVQGGIGTVLELFFTWQLLQVGHISPRPIILVGKDFWGPLIDWVKTYQVKLGLVNENDLRWIYLVDTTDNAVAIVEEEHQKFLASKKESGK